jgi:hypothetical protein
VGQRPHTQRAGLPLFTLLQICSDRVQFKPKATQRRSGGPWDLVGTSPCGGWGGQLLAVPLHSRGSARVCWLPCPSSFARHSAACSQFLQRLLPRLLPSQVQRLHQSPFLLLLLRMNPPRSCMCALLLPQWLAVGCYGLVLNSDWKLEKLRSGEFVPLAANAGPLVCPQSLTTNEGIGHCVGIKPIGSAVVNSTTGGADIFVQVITW